MSVDAASLKKKNRACRAAQDWPDQAARAVPAPPAGGGRRLRRDHRFFSSRRRHTRLQGDWSSDVCSSDLRWLKKHLKASYEPLLQEPWILDVDSTVKPLYGHQQDA